MNLLRGFVVCLFALVTSATLNGEKSSSIQMSKTKFSLPSELMHIKTEIVSAFLAFKKRFNKLYNSTEEELSRFWKFVLNYGKIIQHNNRKNTSFDLELNKFADMDLDEISDALNGLDLPFVYPSFFPEDKHFKLPEASRIPEAIDWRTLGAVTPVKDQGGCGSCYSFSTTGSLEGQYFRKTGILESLSEQQLISCNSMTNGCGGGVMTRSFEYIKKYGIESEKSYPYTGEAGKCLYNRTRVVTRLSRYVSLPRDEKILKAAVAHIGPVSVGIDSRCHSFVFYRSGVYDDKCCSSVRVNHAVLIVGYGVSKEGKPFWIVKNSWSSDWGDDGYILMARGTNHCGIATVASFPII